MRQQYRISLTWSFAIRYCFEWWAGQIFSKFYVKVNFCPSLVPMKKSTPKTWWYTLIYSPINSRPFILFNYILISVFVLFFFLSTYKCLTTSLTISSLYHHLPTFTHLLYFSIVYSLISILFLLFPLLCYPLSHKTTCIGNIICLS